MRIFMKWFGIGGLLSVLLALSLACGGGGGGSTPPPPPPPPPALSVTSVVPADKAQNVAVTANVVVTFSQAVDTSTVNANTVQLTLNGTHVTAALSTAGSVVTLTPSAALSYSTTYKVELVNVKDANGTALTGFVPTSFTTLAPPATFTVSSVSPQNGATNVAVSTNVIFTFSSAVDASTVNATSVQLITASSPVSGTLTVNGSTVTFTPALHLGYAAMYFTNVTSAVKGTNGATLTGFLATSFTTEAAPPPPVVPFKLDPQYLMDSVTTDEVGNVFVVGRIAGTPVNPFVAKFDATGKLVNLITNMGLVAGYYPYGDIYVHGIYGYFPLKNDALQSTLVCLWRLDLMSIPLNLTATNGSKPSTVMDASNNLYYTNFDSTSKNDWNFAGQKVQYTGYTKIAFLYGGVIAAGKTNSSPSVSRMTPDLVATWHDMFAAAGTGFDARGISAAPTTSRFFVSGTTFDATLTNAPRYPLVKGYSYSISGTVETITNVWTTQLVGTDMLCATGGSDDSHYALCTGPDTLTKVKADGTLSWSAPLPRKSTGVAEFSGTLYIADGTNQLSVRLASTGALK